MLNWVLQLLIYLAILTENSSSESLETFELSKNGMKNRQSEQDHMLNGAVLYSRSKRSGSSNHNPDNGINQPDRRLDPSLTQPPLIIMPTFNGVYQSTTTQQPAISLDDEFLQELLGSYCASILYQGSDQQGLEICHKLPSSNCSDGLCETTESGRLNQSDEDEASGIFPQTTTPTLVENVSFASNSTNNTSNFNNVETGNKTDPVSFLFIYNPEGQKPISAGDWHLDGFGENLDFLSAWERCGIFPACELKVNDLEKAQQIAAEYGRDNPEDTRNYPEYAKQVVEVVCDPTSVSIIASVAIILTIIIIISNLVIIIVTLRTKSLRKPHGYFKISLALADLVNGVFVLSNISSNVVQDIHFDYRDLEQIEQIRRVEPNVSEASFFGICAVMSQVVTVYSVLLLSVDSFLSIRWPMQYRVGDLMTSKRAIALVAVVWLFALAVSGLPLLAKDYFSYGLSFTTYSYFPVIAPLAKQMSYKDGFFARYVHGIVFAVAVWGIPFITTWILTMLTAYYSRGMLRSMSAARKKGPQLARTIGRLERDILRTVIIVLTLLTTTVLPMIVALLTISVNIHGNIICLERSVTNLLFGAYYVLACGSFVNVIVYNACHKEFRRSMFDFLCDMITFAFARCCPKYCDMQSVKSSSYRRKNASTRDTRRTTLDTRKYRARLNTLESPCNMSHSDRNGTLQTSVWGTLPMATIKQNTAVVGRQANRSKNRTLSAESSGTSIRDRYTSYNGGNTPFAFRKADRQKSNSLSDVFLPSAKDENRV